MLSDISMHAVFSHYQLRMAAHRQLRAYFKSGDVQRFVELALGITMPEGNYSAAEHNLGPAVLSHNRPEAVFELAKELDALRASSHVPHTIYSANLPYLRISLGSEIAMMLNPDRFWVGNVRTVYAHLLHKHQWKQSLADEELRLYREPDGARPSQMEYKIWRDVYLSLESSLLKIAELGCKEADRQNLPSGTDSFVWADALSSRLYEKHT